MIQNQSSIEINKRLSKQHIVQIQKQVLKQFSNLDINLFEFIDTPIYQNDWIHSVQIGFKNKPILVLLPGYGGTSLAFFKSYKYLYKDFRVIALDLLGTGLSSRKQFKANTHEQSIQYHIEAIEKWRKKRNFSSMYLLGHSFGGYIAFMYSAKYQNYIIKLYLVSPAGSVQTDEVRQNQRMQRRFQNSCCAKYYIMLVRLIYNRKWTPMYILNKIIIGNYFLNRVFQRLNFSEAEKKLWTDYYKEISQLGQSSQESFYIIFKFPLIPNISIQSFLQKKQMSFQIQFFFGDYDWMLSNSEGIEFFEKKYNKVTLKIFKNSGHQVPFQNPASFLEIKE